jgi:hypothetical protein
MPQRAATIVSLPMAFEVVKAMQGDNLEWGEDYRPLARLWPRSLRMRWLRRLIAISTN